MTFLPFLHFTAFLLYLGSGIYVLTKSPRSSLNRITSILLFCFALWSFKMVFVHNPLVDKETAQLFDNIGSFGSHSFASFTLWFALIYTKNRLIKKRFFHLLFFVLPVFMIYKQWQGVLSIDYVKEPFGWSIAWSESVWAYLFFGYYASFIIISILVIACYARNLPDGAEKLQAGILYRSVLIAFVLGTLTDVILPLWKIYILPDVANIVIFIWAFSLVYNIKKYKFMTTIPPTAAENICAVMSDMLILFDQEGKIIKVNNAVSELLGYTKQELMDNPLTKIFTDDSQGTELYEHLIREDGVKGVETFFRSKEGKNIPVLISGSVLKQEDGTPVGFSLLARDITLRKRLEETQKREMEKVKKYIDIAGVIIVALDPQGKVVLINQRGCEILGYDKADIIGKDWFENFIPERFKKQVRQIFIKGLSGFDSPFPRYFENPVITKSGEERIIAWHNSLLRDEAGKVVSTLSSGEDITERKKMEQALKESEERFRQVAEIAEEWIWEINREGLITYSSPALKKILGYQPEEVIGKKYIFDFIPEEFRKESREMIATELEMKKPFRKLVVQNLHKDGGLVILEMSGIPLFDNKNSLRGYRGLGIDITQQKRTERELRALSLLDELTRLYNRRGFMMLAQQRLNALKQKNGVALLFYIDLDNMKWINDNLGHNQGDNALVDAANILKKTFRDVDIISRFGGDEFIVLAVDARLDSADLIKERLRENVRIHNQKGCDYRISFSIGVSGYDSKSPVSLNELIKSADARMYQEKKAKHTNKEGHLN